MRRFVVSDMQLIRFLASFFFSFCKAVIVSETASHLQLAVSGSTLLPLEMRQKDGYIT